MNDCQHKPGRTTRNTNRAMTTKDDEHPLKALLGPILLLKVADPDKWKKPHMKNFKESFSHHGPEKDTLQALDKKELVLLYFSAAWCPPCQKFSPLLKKFYKACQETEGINIEVVYVSSDRDLGEFQEYYSQMPWLAIESQKHKTIATKKCHIQGIPSLVVLNGEGKFVTDQARNAVAAAAGNLDKVKALVEEWKAIEAVPLEEAKFSSFAPLCSIL